MNIEIRKLTPALAEECAQFFDKTPHSEIPYDDECKCYCVWWCSNDQDNLVFNNSLSSQKLRRKYAVENIRSNNIQGYLAYCDGQVVGWCNANTKSDCLKCFCWRHFMGSVPTEELSCGIRVKSVFCFLTALDFRRKGIAKLLLERVCQDAEQDGFDYVEAYPKKAFLNEVEDYMGPSELFKKYGFAVYGETEDKFVMRKSLKEHLSFS